MERRKQKQEKIIKMNLIDDCLYGANEIGAFLDIKPTRVYQLFYGKKLPIFKMGRILVARESTLLQFIEEQEAEASKNCSYK